MKLTIEIPQSYPRERHYILNLLIREFLGIEYRVNHTARNAVRIIGDNGRQLDLEDVLFQTKDESWLTIDSLPSQPLPCWNIADDLPGISLISTKVPLIYGSILPNGKYFQIIDRGIRLGLDIFGSAFYMLSRYEEVVRPEKDVHERFPASASLAYQGRFLNRPIINEYLEILWFCMQQLWPTLRRKLREYQVLLSHDVDYPLSVANKTWPAVFKTTAGDIIRRKDLRLAVRRANARLASMRGNFDVDPANTFDFLMSISERYSLKSAFYFITERTAGKIDGNYSIDMPWIRALMRRMHERGHEIGLHPSYNTFRDASQTKREFSRLLSVAEGEGIQQTEWGGRQHFLRWDASSTWQNWTDAGLTYDSTLTYAEMSGFRCGICYEFPVFNLETQKQLNLRERPLVVMDASLFHPDYMKLSPDDALREIHSLSETCKTFDGQFTLLWHNSSMPGAWHKHYYQEVIESIV